MSGMLTCELDMVAIWGITCMRLMFCSADTLDVASFVTYRHLRLCICIHQSLIQIRGSLVCVFCHCFCPSCMLGYSDRCTVFYPYAIFAGGQWQDNGTYRVSISKRLSASGQGSP